MGRPLKRVNGMVPPEKINNVQNQNYEVMRNLENEYIRSLQQQIYLLELENKYIRQQAATAIDMQPAMVNEASTAVTKIKDMNTKVDSLELELYRKEAHIQMLQQKHDQLDSRLKDSLLHSDQESDQLKRQLVTLRGEREIALREGLHKDEQLTDLRNDLTRHKGSLAAADVQLDLLRAKLEHETSKVSELEKGLNEKRSEMLQMNATLRQLEMQYRQELSRMNVHGPSTELQDRLEHLQRKLTDSFLHSENDRFMRDKQNDELRLMTHENSRLNAEILQIKNQSEQARSAFERLEGRHSRELGELNALRQREKELLMTNANMRKDLQVEQRKQEQMMKHLNKQEKAYENVLTRLDPVRGSVPLQSPMGMGQMPPPEKLTAMQSEMKKELAKQDAKLDRLLNVQQTQSPQKQQQYQNTSQVVPSNFATHQFPQPQLSPRQIPPHQQQQHQQIHPQQQPQQHTQPQQQQPIRVTPRRPNLHSAQPYTERESSPTPSYSQLVIPSVRMQRPTSPNAATYQARMTPTSPRAEAERVNVDNNERVDIARSMQAMRNEIAKHGAILEHLKNANDSRQSHADGVPYSASPRSPRSPDIQVETSTSNVRHFTPGDRVGSPRTRFNTRETTSSPVFKYQGLSPT